MAGERGTVLRERVGSYAIRACLEKLWRVCKARTSPVVDFCGNTSKSLPNPPPELLDSGHASDKQTHLQVDGCERVTAALLVSLATSAWIMGKLLVSGVLQVRLPGLTMSLMQPSQPKECMHALMSRMKTQYDLRCTLGYDMLLVDPWLQDNGSKGIAYSIQVNTANLVRSCKICITQACHVSVWNHDPMRSMCHCSSSRQSIQTPAAKFLLAGPPGELWQQPCILAAVHSRSDCADAASFLKSSLTSLVSLMA